MMTIMIAHVAVVFVASPQDSTTLLAMQSVFQLRQSICNRLVSFKSPLMTRPMISTFCSRWQWTRWVGIYHAPLTRQVVRNLAHDLKKRDHSSQIRSHLKLNELLDSVHSLFFFHTLWPWRNFDTMCLVKKSTRKSTTVTTGCWGKPAFYLTSSITLFFPLDMFFLGLEGHLHDLLPPASSKKT